MAQTNMRCAVAEEVAAPKKSVFGGGAMYAEIPGFKFNYDTHPAKVESKEECEQMCNSRKFALIKLQCMRPDRHFPRRIDLSVIQLCKENQPV